jgi:hypothetical protein
MLDYDWCDLDFAPLPVFDSESESELIDDESDTIFECKKQSLEYSECLLYDDLHWVNDLDELDKTLDAYKGVQSTESSKVIVQQINDQHNTNTKKSCFSSEEYYIFNNLAKLLLYTNTNVRNRRLLRFRALK